jgi:hypothetical protein
VSVQEFDSDRDEFAWYVWCPESGPPTHRHGSERDAIREAERLARNNPGHRFMVLQLVGTAQRVDVEFIRPTREDLPF